QAATVAVIAALRRRRATGEGARIEVWQYAMALACLGPQIVNAQIDGTPLTTFGNRCPDRAPHGVYPSRGEERPVAPAVEDEQMWARLCEVPGLRHLRADARFASLAERLEHHDDLDTEIAAWTRTRTEWEAANELQHFGVAACPVLDDWDLVADRQLEA